MFLYVVFPGQREGNCPHPVPMITEPTPPSSSAAGPRSPNQAENETESESTESGWLSHPDCSADPNTETTSGTTSAADPQGTRLKTVEKHQGEEMSAGEILLHNDFIPVCETVEKYCKITFTSQVSVLNIVSKRRRRKSSSDSEILF